MKPDSVRRRSMVETALQQDEALGAALDPWYKGTDDPAVREFLTAHPFLIPLLQDAPAALGQYFPDASLFLEGIPDPETGSDPELVLAISPPCPPDEAVDRYTQFT